MPSRPIQHQLEDESRVEFQHLLPSRWVFRDKQKDYGIDGEVELFDSSNQAQGLMFYVQLKATASEDDAFIMSTDLSMDSLKYYQQLEIPVLLVKYSKHRECLYIKWIYNVDVSMAKAGSQTFRIRFSEDDRWTDLSDMAIEKRLVNVRALKSGHFRLPIPYTLVIQENAIEQCSPLIFQTQIRRHLSQYSDYLRYDSEDNAVIRIFLDSEELKLNVCDLTEYTFHRKALENAENTSREVAEDILLGTAASMASLGRIDYCGKIIFEKNLEARLTKNKDLLLLLLPRLFQSLYLEKVLDLIGNILDNHFSAEVQIISTINVLISSRCSNVDRLAVIEQFFKRRLVSALSSNDRTQIGVSHYNLGNHYRSRSMYSESIQNYIDAKRFEPKYLRQHYYYSELAGCFFLSGRYRFAAKLYGRAIELGATGMTEALYADALLFSGEYEKSLETFNDYLQKEQKPIDEFLLKHICLGQVLQKKNIKSQNREIERATAQADISSLESTCVQKKKLDDVLNLDLLCGLAWFNQGLLAMTDSDFEEALISFAMAGLVQSNDLEAWTNATLCTFNLTPESMPADVFGLIVRTAYAFNGEKYLEELYHSFETINKDAGEFSKISALIDKILPQRLNKKDSPVTVRVMNKQGMFENVFKG